MRAYIIKRLLLTIPVLFIVTILVFFTLRLIPGDVITIMIESSKIPLWEGAREALEQKLGLDVPWYTQYGRWIRDIFLHGSLGTSLWGPAPVTEEILGRLPVSIELGLLALVVAQIVGLPIGIYSALRQDSGADYLGRSLAILWISLPSFWTAILVMTYPTLWWGWHPPLVFIPFTEDPLGNLTMFAIPAFILGMAMSGGVMRMTRSMMLEVLRQDYIRTAWSKGLKERLVVWRHALKNALIPVITIIGMEIPLLVSGAVIIENIFALPGLGRLAVTALTARDYPIVSGINLVVATLVIGTNLLTDLTYGYLDPRVRYG